VHADFGKRVGLLRAFAELEEAWRPSLERAIAALEAERSHRRERSAAEIADCLIECMTMVETARLEEDADRGALQNRLTLRLQRRIRARERTTREVVQSIYRHAGLKPEETSTAELLGTELFAEEGWELFGLSHNQLAMSGMISGAVAGGAIDALLGGATLLLGAGIGAIIGGVGAWLGGDELAKVTLLGQRLGGPVLQVGPVATPNFPWVMLGRAWVHHQMVAERNHARREVMSLAVSADEHLMDAIPETARRRLGELFKAASDGDLDAESQPMLTALIAELLKSQPAEDDSKGN